MKLAGKDIQRLRNQSVELETKGKTWFVDGSISASGAGKNWATSFKTIQEAVDAAASHDWIKIAPRDIPITSTDPVSYAETIIIPNTKPFLTLEGVSRGRTQGGLPQIKIGAGSTAVLTIRAPGCLIKNLGFNGGSSTGGGILLDDNGTTKVAFGTTIQDCHFKNCAGATSADTGGAIQIGSDGGAWQLRVERCSFFRCMGGVINKGTGQARPVDIVIEDCLFYTNDTALVDCDIYLMGGDGVDGLVIRNCTFATRTVPAYAGTSRYIKLTGCTDGLISGCTFNCLANVTATELTWGTAGTAAFIPSAVGIAGCYGVSTTRGETGEIGNL